MSTVYDGAVFQIKFKKINFISSLRTFILSFNKCLLMYRRSKIRSLILFYELLVAEIGLRNVGGTTHSETVTVDNILSTELWAKPEFFKADLLFWNWASLGVTNILLALYLKQCRSIVVLNYITFNNCRSVTLFL